MSTRRIRGAPGALAVLMLFASLVAPPVRAAGDASGSGDADEGWKKVVAYAHCAFSVFRAVTPLDWSAALLTCTRLFMEEPSVPGGAS